MKYLSNQIFRIRNKNKCNILINNMFSVHDCRLIFFQISKSFKTVKLKCISKMINPESLGCTAPHIKKMLKTNEKLNNFPTTCTFILHYIAGSFVRTVRTYITRTFHVTARENCKRYSTVETLCECSGNISHAVNSAFTTMEIVNTYIHPCSVS